MGSGSFSRVIYGTADIATPNEKVDGDALAEFIDDVCELYSDLRTASSDPNENQYFGVELLCSLSDRGSKVLSIGTLPLAQLAERINATIWKDARAQAIETWKLVQALGKERGIVVPDGELVWCDDYD